MGNILRDQMFYRSKQLSVSINQKRKDQFLQKWYIGINTSTKRNELKKILPKKFRICNLCSNG